MLVMEMKCKWQILVPKLPCLLLIFILINCTILILLAYNLWFCAVKKANLNWQQQDIVQIQFPVITLSSSGKLLWVSSTKAWRSLPTRLFRDNFPCSLIKATLMIPIIFHRGGSLTSRAEKGIFYEGGGKTLLFSDSYFTGIVGQRLCLWCTRAMFLDDR